jgi:hypothetical protein
MAGRAGARRAITDAYPALTGEVLSIPKQRTGELLKNLTWALHAQTGQPLASFRLTRFRHEITRDWQEKSGRRWSGRIAMARRCGWREGVRAVRDPRTARVRGGYVEGASLPHAFRAGAGGRCAHRRASLSIGQEHLVERR